MKQLINDMRQPVLDFIDQRDGRLQLITGKLFEQAILRKTVSEMDRGNKSDLFFVSAEPFVDAEQYVGHIEKRMHDDYREFLLWTDLENEVAKVAAKHPAPILPSVPMSPAPRSGPSLGAPPAAGSAAPPRKRKAAPFKKRPKPLLPKTDVVTAPSAAEGPGGPSAAMNLPDKVAHFKPKVSAPSRSKLPDVVPSSEPSVIESLAKADETWQPASGLDELETRFQELFVDYINQDTGTFYEREEEESLASLVNRLNPAYPPPPSFGPQSEIPVKERFCALLAYGLSYLPNGRDHRFVFCFIPPEVKDVGGWHGLMHAAVDNPRFAGQTGLKLMGGYDPQAEIQLCQADEDRLGIVRPPLHEKPDVWLHAVDLSDEARRASEEAQVADPATDERDRMALLLTMAIRDGVQNRPELAMERLDTTYRYFMDHNIPDMAALSATGFGDIFLRAHNWDAARAAYAMGIEPALESKNPIVIYSLSQNLGEACFRGRRFEEAEQAYGAAARAAEEVGQVPAEVSALERHGAACIKIEQWDRAQVSFEKAATLCSEHPEAGNMDTIMRSLKKVYAKQNRRSEWGRFRERIQQLSKGA